MLTIDEIITEAEEEIRPMRAGYEWGVITDDTVADQIGYMTYEFTRFQNGICVCKTNIYRQSSIVGYSNNDLEGAYKDLLMKLDFNTETNQVLDKPQYKLLDFKDSFVFTKQNDFAEKDYDRNYIETVLKKVIRNPYVIFENDNKDHIDILVSTNISRFPYTGQILDKFKYFLALNWTKVTVELIENSSYDTVGFIKCTLIKNKVKDKIKPLKEFSTDIRTIIPGYTFQKDSTNRVDFFIYKSVRDMEKTSYEDDTVPKEINSINKILYDLEKSFIFEHIFKDYIHCSMTFIREDYDKIITSIMKELADYKWRKYEFTIHIPETKDKLINDNFLIVNLTAWKFDIISPSNR
jgi:hypothetical protein